MLEEIIDCIDIGIFITDGNGNILTLNEISAKISSMQKQDLIGKNFPALIADGTFPENESCTIEAIKMMKKVSRIQKSLRGDYTILATSTPHIKDGCVQWVVTTERDISQILELEAKALHEREKADRHSQELDYYRKQSTEIMDGVVAKSVVMQRLFHMAMQVAGYDATVLLQGETGAGKEVVAKMIQKSSKRNDKPYLTINCAAIPESLLESELFGYEKGAFTGASDRTKLGIFELADEGTVLLDEVDTLPFHQQSKLLRVLQEGKIFRVGGNREIKVNVRVMATTNTNLASAVQENKFRKDLFYRLNVVPFTIPALRERKDDIFPLAELFIKRYNLKYNENKRLSATAMRTLQNHEWPGNVRELENLMERLVITAAEPVITGGAIKSLLYETPLSGGESLQEKMDAYERGVIGESMRYTKNSKELAALLGIDKSTLTRKIRKHGIKPIYMQKTNAE
ncbi:MAG: sigma 54-interacting transcriptional regulator [Clostridiales Family XIII bacterium]|jgi:PAS domain S-box-containing protein|nr:sigma 54-interacting transcriptional regulator [Clostridiales Family XIII bacterium]